MTRNDRRQLIVSQLPLEEGKYYIMHRVLSGNGVRGLSIVGLNDAGELSITDFSGEKHSTAWVDGIGIIINRGDLTEFLLDDLLMIANRGLELMSPQTVSAIDTYLRASSLYAPYGSSPKDCAFISIR